MLNDELQKKMNDRPSIDHGLLSPSGKMSKRARAAALERERKKLFPPGFWDVKVSPEEALAKKIAGIRRSAKNMRELAARGMSPRKFTCQAERMEKEADMLEKGGV